MDKKIKVLFLSTGNSVRSQMAEGYLRKLGCGKFDAVSAGIEPSGISPVAVEVMREIGIDISKQQPKNVKESLKEHFAYVITVCDMAKERAPIFPFTPNLLHWSLVDPSRETGSPDAIKNVFRRVRDEIGSNVEGFLRDVAQKEKKQEEVAAVLHK